MTATPLLQELVDSVRASESSSFYRNRWGNARSFEELPLVARDDFFEPLSSRRYKDSSALVKIVHGTHAFLSEWSFSDIALEAFGEPSKRPFVYMIDPYEAIEKSMWCYERGMVPLIGEKDPDIAMFAAEKYEVDSLITDPIAVGKLMPYLEKHRLSSISIVGDAFDLQQLAPLAAVADSVRLVLATPETGAFAAANIDGQPRFEALAGNHLEESEDGIIVTKERLLVTPVIRFQTGIRAAIYGA